METDVLSPRHETSLEVERETLTVKQIEAELRKVIVGQDYLLDRLLVGLLARGLSFSIPAAVGLIALAGVAVLNGVILASDVRARLDEGASLDDALLKGSVHTVRAVLTTGAVAALGFLPMALATGAGSEVQRPLATVVVIGIVCSTWMTMFVLPGVLRLALGRRATHIACARTNASETPA